MHRKESGKHQFDIYHFIPDFQHEGFWSRTKRAVREYLGLGVPA